MFSDHGHSRLRITRIIWDRQLIHWIEIFLVVYGSWVIAPLLAPVFMHFGWNSGGRTIYFLYSFFCHQLPERSFFLFGPKVMYSLAEIQPAWQYTNNPLILRGFVGNPAFGWKVAWSDRMISFYTSVWLFVLAWYVFRRKVSPLSWPKLALFLLPIILDGGTHLLSDLAGIGQGFRDTNRWLAAITGNLLPASFYAGDAIGSFNSWMRLITGLLAGVGLGWFALAHALQTDDLTEELDELNVKMQSREAKLKAADSV